MQLFGQSIDPIAVVLTRASGISFEVMLAVIALADEAKRTLTGESDVSGILPLEEADLNDTGVTVQPK